MVVFAVLRLLFALQRADEQRGKTGNDPLSGGVSNGVQPADSVTAPVINWLISVDTIEYTGRDRVSWLQVVDSREVTLPGRSPKLVPTLVTCFPGPASYRFVVRATTGKARCNEGSG